MKRLALPRQRIQDILKALESPVAVNGVDKPFYVVNLELLKKKAVEGHAPSQRYLDKLYREALEEIANRKPELEKRIDKHYGYLNLGDPPSWVIASLNDIILDIDQLYKDPNAWPATERLRAKKARDRRHAALKERVEAMLRAEEERRRLAGKSGQKADDDER